MNFQRLFPFVFLHELRVLLCETSSFNIGWMFQLFVYFTQKEDDSGHSEFRYGFLDDGEGVMYLEEDEAYCC